METVCSVCNSVRSIAKDGVSFQKLLTTLRKEFRNRGFGIKIKSIRDKKMEVEEFYVNAYYDPEDDREGDISIEVNIHHNFNVDAIWDRKHVTELLIQIFDATVHEFKHQRQSVKRKYMTYTLHEQEPYRAYLADPDEVDAYAFSIAVELTRSLGKYRAMRYLSKFSGLCKLKFNGKYVSPSLSAYYGQFGTINNTLMRRLSKKVYVRLRKIDTASIFV